MKRLQPGEPGMDNVVGLFLTNVDTSTFSLRPEMQTSGNSLSECTPTSFLPVT